MRSTGENVAGRIAEAVLPGKKVRRLTIHLEVGSLAMVEAEIYCGDELRKVEGVIGDRPEWRFLEEETVSETKWISVDDYLPEDGKWCYVDWDGPGKPFPAMRDTRSAGGWTNTDCWEDFDREVTRWFPLPPPPGAA